MLRTPRIFIIPVFLGVLSLVTACSRKLVSPTAGTTISGLSSWVSKADGSMKFEKIDLSAKEAGSQVIAFDAATKFQDIEGFGYALTGSSAQLLMQMSPAKRAALLQSLFGNGPNDHQISYLRISIGASDLDPVVFSYNDLPAGQTDPGLKQFSLSRDTQYLIPVLKAILKIRPDLRIMGSPWSPPVWMKDNGNSKGGKLLPQWYGVYAQYFVKYIQAMAKHGVVIHAVTPQNEPEHGGNNPSLTMTWEEQATFIRDHLGPIFQKNGIKTRIIIWDHNCDHPEYPIQILNDAAARKYIDGSAFHMYAGDETALGKVKEKHPDKRLYFTEQWTGSKGEYGGDLMWHTRHIIIGTLRHWSSIALEWNLASDPGETMHTPGGCDQCLGALTIHGDEVRYNASYTIIGHASRFVPPGSVRVATNALEQIPNVGFITPSGKKVLIVLNETAQARKFQLTDGNARSSYTLPAQSVVTMVW